MVQDMEKKLAMKPAAGLCPTFCWPCAEGPGGEGSMEGPHPSSPPLWPWGKEQWEEWCGVGLGGRGTSSNSQTSLSRPFQTPLSAYAQSRAVLRALCCNAVAPSHRRVLHLSAAATRAAVSMPYVLVPDTVPPLTRMLTTSHSLPLPRWTCSCPFPYAVPVTSHQD